MRYRRRKREEPGLLDVLFDVIGMMISNGFRFIRRVVSKRKQTRLQAEVRPAIAPRRRQRKARREARRREAWASLSPVRPHRGPVNQTDVSLPYRRTEHLLSRGEQALWFPLYQAVKGKYRLFCKVRLADVVCCPRKHPDERTWFRKIGRYHVDFVLAEPKTTAPLLVVELDDRRHRQRVRQERDEFKDRVLRAAGVPIYRVQAQAAYAPDELAREIERLLNTPV